MIDFTSIMLMVKFQDLPIKDANRMINEIIEKGKLSYNSLADKNKCTFCKINYVDSDNGFDTCQECLSKM